MPRHDPAGPPAPDLRTEARRMQMMVRTMPWLDWWPRRRDGGEAADAGNPVSPCGGASGGAEPLPS